jgi:phosphatidylglycerol---prolipoprotein diacylglyceryl transferase
MIPYFRQPGVSLGPVTVHAFGALVVCAVWLGTTILQRRAQAGGLERALSSRFVNWILLGAFLGAHLFDRLVYFPGETARDPLSLLRLWEGLSSFGGFVGGTTAGLLFFKRHVPVAARWVLVDSFAFAFPFAWIFGRLGCFSVHDHIGKLTTFPLSVRFPDGARHDLGLDEALWAMVISATFYVLGRKPRPGGFFLATWAVMYAPMRFFLDFLRNTDVKGMSDVRWAGLTPAQWGCILMFLGGVFIWGRLFRATRAPQPA